MRRGRGRLADAALQGAPAVLEGELPDDPRAGADGAPVPAHLLARAGEERRGVRRAGALHRVPGARPRHDVGAAERVRQQLVVADAVEDERQPHLHPAAAALAARSVRRLHRRRDGARPRRRPRRVPGDAVLRAVAAVDAASRSGRSPSRCSAARSSARWGSIAAIAAEKFDQVSAFQNFIIMPLTFLSGVFYSIQSLPPFWQAASHVNPFFYMIDGFRYGFFGLSDVPPLMSLAIVGASLPRAVGAHAHAAPPRVAAAAPDHRTFANHGHCRIHRTIDRRRARLHAPAGHRRRPPLGGADRQPRLRGTVQGPRSTSSSTRRSATGCARKSTRCR